MKKLLAIMLLMSLMTVSCNKDDGNSSEKSTQTVVTDNGNSTPEPEPTPTPDVPTPTTNLPALAISFSTNVTLFEFTGAQDDKYNQAVDLVKKVIGTEAFRTKVLNFTFNGAKQFANNNGQSNAQIYQAILEAAERLTPAKNNTLDVGVKLYFENSNVVGYTSSNVTFINVNTKFFDSYEIHEVAGNLFHEWLHKMGYIHDSAATAQRPSSVPYAVGYMIRDIGKNFL